MSSNNSTKSLLNIDFNIKKGLILKWNFTGQLSKDNFYRHLIIIDSDKSKAAQSFIELYYKKIRSGDLFCIKKKEISFDSKILKWRQKSLLTFPNFDRNSWKNFNLQELSQILLEVAQNLEVDESHQPLILTIFTEKEQPQILMEIISKIRNQKKVFNFITNYFGKFQNSINFGTGINFFQFNPLNSEDVLEFYKNYINKIQFYFVELNIQCQNGTICCQRNSQWPNLAFNKIAKKFYAPHMHYESDVLLFFNTQNYGDLDLVLHISLAYQTLQGKKFKSSKRISLKSLDRSIQSRTIGLNENTHELQMHKNVWFDKYPFKSQNFVWFKKNKDFQSNVGNKMEGEFK